MYKADLFNNKVERIQVTFDELMSQKPRSPELLLERGKEVIRGGGVYVFSEGGIPSEEFFYVGQAKQLLNRLKEHCVVKNYEKANFAYAFTVDFSGMKPIPYSPDSTKESMFQIPEFLSAFDETIVRIRSMNYRYINVEDTLEKNLLEIYAAVVLSAKYNHFD